MVRLLIILVCLISSWAAQAEITEVTASIDKNPVVVNESFVLRVEVNDDVNADQYQPSQLFDNFVVGRTTTSRETAVINGYLTKKTRFTTVLISQQPGNFIIPPIRIGNAQSEAIDLKVLKAGSQPAGRSDRIAFMTAQLSHDSVYVQQQVSYITKLYLAADLNKGALSKPQLDDADIYQIGQDQESSEMIDGRRYRVYERRYQITPNRSGEFDITGARFDGEVYTDRSQAMFSSFSGTQPVSAIAPLQKLTVKPMPSNWQGAWLPSDLVTLSREFNPDSDSIKVGEPVTVTMMLTAVGVKPEQLPELKLPLPDQLKVYPDNENTDQFTRNGTHIAQKTVSFAVIANAAGEFTIPAMRIPWLNTRTGKTNYAQVPAKTLQVTGTAEQVDTRKLENSQATPTQPTASVENDSQDSDSNASDNDVSSNSLPAFWLWLSAGLALLWLLTVLLWWWSLRRAHQQRLQHQQQRQRQQLQRVLKPWQALQRACRDNQAEPAAQALLAWYQQHSGKPVHRLSVVAEDLQDAELSAQLQRLQQHLYGTRQAQTADWQAGKALYQALKRAVAEQQRQAPADDANALPQLYLR
ncbi:BatD family protein [Idiomarina xiamenensis]|uniref:DUF7939 domain-containing protein n=1 Tax=Idiomarina xiamenensis 10-D-4 TaxID=740709 RepID=K2KMX9_9GAMM|nr:BatD family protein [Idiomarina xiamenensis]EKE83809.1 hypothetical protein A10D4_06671 [Idiomarina xiamenensis 10-D-4]